MMANKSRYSDELIGSIVLLVISLLSCIISIALLSECYWDVYYLMLFVAEAGTHALLAWLYCMKCCSYVCIRLFIRQYRIKNSYAGNVKVVKTITHVMAALIVFEFFLMFLIGFLFPQISDTLAQILFAFVFSISSSYAFFVSLCFVVLYWKLYGIALLASLSFSFSSIIASFTFLFVIFRI